MYYYNYTVAVPIWLVALIIRVYWSGIIDVNGTSMTLGRGWLRTGILSWSKLIILFLIIPVIEIDMERAGAELVSLNPQV